MTDFTPRMEDDLRWHFGAEFGASALRSGLGGSLEAMKNGAVEPIPRTGDFMPVRRQDPNANRDFDYSDGVLAEVGRDRRIRRALGLLGPHDHAVLRAMYTPAPRELGRSPVLDVLFGDEARDVAAQARHEDREQRRAGGKALASMEHQGKVAVEAAQEAYALACEAMAQAERDERRARFSEGLG